MPPCRERGKEVIIEQGKHRSWHSRLFPFRHEVVDALKKEHAEWVAHGDCQYSYYAHLLAMEVRRLQSCLKSMKRRPRNG